MDRTQKILAKLAPAGQVGLEIGPLFSPIVTRELGQVFYVDHDSTEGLRAKYEQIPEVDVSKIVEVDYVWGEKRLSELTGDRAPFDYVIASHVVEHVPDLVGWLAEVHQILKPGGILSLAIPDRRYCFDYFRSNTRLADVVEAYLVGSRKPTPRQIFDHIASAVKWNGNIAWGVPPVETELVPVHSHLAAWERAKVSLAEDAYWDVHCWVFTDTSFLELFKALVQLNLIEYRIAQFYRTEGCEFFVSLEALDVATDVDQRRSLQMSSLPASITLGQPSAADSPVRATFKQSVRQFAKKLLTKR